MKVSLGELFNMEDILKKMMQSYLEIDIMKSYQLSKCIKKILSEISLINEERTKLIRKYGQENKGIIQVLPENVDKYIGELNGFLKNEIEVDFVTIPLAALTKFREQNKLTQNDLLLIKNFIEEDVLGVSEGEISRIAEEMLDEPISENI